MSVVNILTVLDWRNTLPYIVHQIYNQLLTISPLIFQMIHPKRNPAKDAQQQQDDCQLIESRYKNNGLPERFSSSSRLSLHNKGIMKPLSQETESDPNIQFGSCEQSEESGVKGLIYVCDQPLDEIRLFHVFQEETDEFQVHELLDIECEATNQCFSNRLIRQQKNGEGCVNGQEGNLQGHRKFDPQPADSIIREHSSQSVNSISINNRTINSFPRLEDNNLHLESERQLSLLQIQPDEKKPMNLNGNSIKQLQIARQSGPHKFNGNERTLNQSQYSQQPPLNRVIYAAAAAAHPIQYGNLSLIYEVPSETSLDDAPSQKQKVDINKEGEMCDVQVSQKGLVVDYFDNSPVSCLKIAGKDQMRKNEQQLQSDFIEVKRNYQSSPSSDSQGPGNHLSWAFRMFQKQANMVMRGRIGGGGAINVPQYRQDFHLAIQKCQSFSSSAAEDANKSDSDSIFFEEYNGPQSHPKIQEGGHTKSTSDIYKTNNIPECGGQSKPSITPFDNLNIRDIDWGRCSGQEARRLPNPLAQFTIFDRIASDDSKFQPSKASDQQTECKNSNNNHLVAPLDQAPIIEQAESLSTPNNQSAIVFQVSEFSQQLYYKTSRAMNDQIIGLPVLEDVSAEDWTNQIGYTPHITYDIIAKAQDQHIQDPQLVTEQGVFSACINQNTRKYCEIKSDNGFSLLNLDMVDNTYKQQKSTKQQIRSKLQLLYSGVDISSFKGNMKLLSKSTNHQPTYSTRMETNINQLKTSGDNDCISDEEIESAK
ncbi:hypothetical protein FGO68_gene15631 [Halteria grandinella]|uniref:Uncharacterized protein n=1 Tax=Halteria grandinella TaxID=5974 RepID=A0A8J8T5A9_HALGN|nr:hypothetical protein FGO68_gene15631 [Halteria grandinella]